MAYEPISGTVPQYMKDAAGTTASGYYLKFYRAGTTTAIQMATDSTAETLLNKCTLNTRGEPISDDAAPSSVFIPHLNESYKIALYATEDDADNNNTDNAVWIVDSISVGSTSVGTALGYATVNSDAVSGATALDVEKAFENTYRRVLGSSASDVLTYTVQPNSGQSWTAGATITFSLQGGGIITIAQGSGVTINWPDFIPSTASSFSLKHKGQYCVLKYVSTDTWDAIVAPPPFADIVTRTSTSNTPTVEWGGRINYMSNASATTITIQNEATQSWQVGQRMDFVREGVGTVSFVASGVTINSAAGNLSIKNQYGGASLIYKGSDVFSLIGDLDT